ncbi:UPF0729 protein GD16342 [Musca autumnalis]|uniref:UPF0729 protein GD16342 n=1 Tax=Musca autumnalis TaxID=221902 RepID=UPI003CEE5FD0
MVCVPCFIIPVLLYIWHKFIQPIILRYWNPWEKKDAQGNVIKAGPEFPFECKGGVCPYPGAKKKLEDGKSTATTETKPVTREGSSENKKD